MRLGDGTEESHQKMAEALTQLWPYTGELYTPSAVDTWAFEHGIGP